MASQSQGPDFRISRVRPWTQRAEAPAASNLGWLVQIYGKALVVVGLK